MRRGAGGWRYLLVRARRDPTAWVFPKGHVEPGETAEAAAVREVREEAGVEAEILRPLDVLAFPDASVALFLMRYVGEATAAETRDSAWCDYDEARRRLTFPESRELLSQVQARLEAGD